MKSLNSKIVYLHLLDGVVVYVGSGSHGRLNSKTSRSVEHLAIWHKLDKSVYMQNLSPKDASDLEQILIFQYWDTGNLINKNKIVNQTRQLSFKELNDVFYCDNTSSTGLRWKKKVAKKISIGNEAGSLKLNTTKTKSYYEVGLGGVSFHTHRIVYCLTSGKDLDSTLVIDHIDGNGLNNDAANLRAVSQSENVRNRPHFDSNTGEHNVSESVSRNSFTVVYTENSEAIKTCFTYGLNGALTNPRAFRDRDLALRAAIDYRDYLVKLGKIYKVKNDK